MISYSTLKIMRKFILGTVGSLYEFQIKVDLQRELWDY